MIPACTRCNGLNRGVSIHLRNTQFAKIRALTSDVNRPRLRAFPSFPAVPEFLHTFGAGMSCEARPIARRGGCIVALQGAPAARQGGACPAALPGSDARRTGRLMPPAHWRLILLKCNGSVRIFLTSAQQNFADVTDFVHFDRFVRCIHQENEPGRVSCVKLAPPLHRAPAPVGAGGKRTRGQRRWLRGG